MKHFKKRISKALLGTATSISVLTGCNPSDRISDDIGIVDEYKDEVIDIDLSYKIDLAITTGFDINHDYTVKDLEGIVDGLEITVRDGLSLKWLNYCTNLNSIFIGINNRNDIDLLKDINNLDSLKCFYLFDNVGNYIDRDSLSFIDNDKLEGLFLYGNVIVDKDYLYSFKNLNILGLSGETAKNFDIDMLDNLNKLKALYLGSRPYDTAIYIDSKDYDKVISKNINVFFENDDYLENFKNANKVLDDISIEIGLNQDISNKEKLNNIILYTVDSYNYDTDIADRLNNGELPSTESFYGYGLLTGIINGNGSIICGNYTALVSALTKRCNLEVFNLKSSNHAWNLIGIEGEYYYVDATMLDAYNSLYGDNYVSDNLDNLEWFMKKYQSNEELDNVHNIVNIGYEEIDKMIIDEVEEKEIDDNIDIFVGNQRRVIAIGAAIGILGGLGFARRAYIKKQRKRKKR